jgi:rhodanese-related sulfurtransferase
MKYEFKNKLPNPHFENVTDVSPQEVNEQANSLHLIDVREESEFVGELGHIPSAKLVILSTIPEKIKTLPTDKPIVFVCRSGGRSAQAASFAMQEGLTNVYNMQGGMLLWNQLQLPVET